MAEQQPRGRRSEVQARRQAYPVMEWMVVAGQANRGCAEMGADKIGLMPDTSPRVARPRGRPRKDAEFAPTDKVMAAAIEAFSVHGYNGVSLRTVNDELGVSRNLLYQRFGSHANHLEADVDWAFRPLLDHQEAADDESAAPVVRLRIAAGNFTENSATRPYLARLVM